MKFLLWQNWNNSLLSTAAVVKSFELNFGGHTFPSTACKLSIAYVRCQSQKAVIGNTYTQTKSINKISRSLCEGLYLESLTCHGCLL